LKKKQNLKKSLWYDKISIRGYAQIRYNGLLSSNDKVSCEQCDRSWGTTATGDDVKSNNGLFIRRARIVFAGQIHPNVYFYIQPDIASSPVAGANNFSSYEMLISICHLIQKKNFV
jgi:hypothetical protein